LRDVRAYCARSKPVEQANSLGWPGGGCCDSGLPLDAGALRWERDIYAVTKACLEVHGENPWG
jgi:hypothetical protein